MLNITKRRQRKVKKVIKVKSLYPCSKKYLKPKAFKMLI
jgi:hypothetical protein